MPAANDKIAYAESAAREYTDLDAARRRLIELEKTRIFSDEDLALLIRKSAQSNLKEGFEARTLNRRSRASSNRTTGGRTVIRSWDPAVVDEAENIDSAAENESVDGWKEFVAASKSNRGAAREDCAARRTRVRRCPSQAPWQT